MKIKIGDQPWLDLDPVNGVPFSIQFTDEELEQVKMMNPEDHPNKRFSAIPSDWTKDQYQEWANK